MRSLPTLGLAAAAASLLGCGAPSPTDAPSLEASSASSVSLTAARDVAEAPGASVEVAREHVVDDIWHYAYLLRLGDGPNGSIRVHRVTRERSPRRPQSARAAAMLLHGDFSTFATSFAPSLGTPASSETGLAVHLAKRGVDVWGFDRRWTLAPAEGGDLSDFGGMGVAAEVSDIRSALAFATERRGASGAEEDRFALVGFSHGAQLAYVYASVEAARPPCERFVKALVPLDIYAEIAPEDEALRQAACASRDAERTDLANGVVDSDNGFFVSLGALALSAPNDVSPIFTDRTNLAALLYTVGETYQFYAPTPSYHLAATVLSGGAAVAFRDSPRASIATWLAAAAPHQSLRESAELDALWCGQAPLPIDAPLARIHVPLFYVGAAGGFGDHGLYTTTRVASADITRRVIRRLPADREAEDFGHGDILFAKDAPALVWEPVASWIVRH